MKQVVNNNKNTVRLDEISTQDTLFIREKENIIAVVYHSFDSWSAIGLGIDINKSSLGGILTKIEKEGYTLHIYE